MSQQYQYVLPEECVIDALIQSGIRYDSGFVKINREVLPASDELIAAIEEDNR